MRKYIIRRGGFGNVYSLAYTEDGTIPDGWEQITRKEAETYSRRESRRRKDDPDFAYLASEYIYPFWTYARFYGGVDFLDLARSKRGGWYLSGRVVERRGHADE